MSISKIHNGNLTTNISTTVSRQQQTKQLVFPSTEVLLAHPEAIRRRQEALKRREQLQKKKQRLQQSATKLSWWQLDVPNNVQLAYSVDDLKNVIECSIENKQLVVVEFFAPWCIVCNNINDSFHQLAVNRPHVQFVKFSVAGKQNKDFCMEELGVKNVPYFALYYNGYLLSRLKTTKNNLKLLKREIDNHDPWCQQMPTWLKTLDEIFM